MQKSIENLTFLSLLALVSVAFLWILEPFFGPVFWAVTIAILFAPVQNALHERLPGHRNLNALLTLLLSLVIVILPLMLTIYSVVGQIAGYYQKLEGNEIDVGAYVQQIQDNFPALRSWMTRLGINVESLKESAVNAVMTTGQAIAQHSLTIGQNTLGFVLDIGVMLYVAFYFIRDGKNILALLYKALPLDDGREKLLFRKFAEVIRATVKGNVVVAIIQGGIGGITFAILGIGGALLWGVVMALASLIPALGASLIWGPVVIYLFATGTYIKAVILLIIGALFIGLIDNFLRPILVGRDTKLPDYLVLLSTLGGLVLFGINGFVVGPLIASLFIAVWGIFIREFQGNNEAFKTG